MPDLLTDLVSYWKLDEASGNALDSHGSNEMTDTNTVGAGTGKINGSRHFNDSANEYFVIADNTSISTGDIDFTWQAWVNVDIISGVDPIIFKYHGSDTALREYALYLNSGGIPHFLVCDGTNFGIAVWGSALSTGTWHHLIGYHDSVNNVVGVVVNNGTPVTVAHSTGVQDTAASLTFGTYDNQANFYDGQIDEVGFWKRMLTSQERSDLYNSGNGLPYSSFGGSVGPANLKTFDGLAKASVKSVNNLVIASVKTFDGLN